MRFSPRDAAFIRFFKDCALGENPSMRRGSGGGVPGWGDPLWVIEEITDGAEAPEVKGMLRVVLKIFSQADDEIVDRPGGGHAGVAPSHLQKDLARQGLAPVGDEDLEQSRLLLRQLDRSLPALRRQRRKVDRIAAEGISLRLTGFFLTDYRRNGPGSRRPLSKDVRS